MPSLADKWKQWRECLLGKKDDNSIVRQIMRITTDYAFYRYIFEGKRQYLNRHGYFTDMIWRWFGVYFWVMFRKQIDSSGLEGDRGVYSIRSLVKDMRDCEHLITEENLPANRFGSNRISPSEVMDILCEISCKCDLAYEEAGIYINKHITHAATPQSRESVEITDKSNPISHYLRFLHLCFHSISTRVFSEEYSLFGDLQSPNKIIDKSSGKKIEIDLADIDKSYQSYNFEFTDWKSDPLRKLRDWKV